MVAIVRRYTPQVTEQATPAREVRAPQTAVGELGRAFDDLGEAAWTYEDELATAHAYQVDAEFTDFMRVTMHGDGPEGESNSGYLAMQGMDATNALGDVVERVRSRYSELVSSLNPRVRAATVRSLETRYQSFLGQANRHAEAQARAARAAAASRRTGAAAAAVQATARDYMVAAALGDDTEMAALEGAIADELVAQGLQEGTPQYDEAFRERTSWGTELLVTGIDAEQGPQAARTALTEGGLIDRLRPQEIDSVVMPILRRATEADGRDIADAEVTAAIDASREQRVETEAAAPPITASRFTDTPGEFLLPGETLGGTAAPERTPGPDDGTRGGPAPDAVMLDPIDLPAPAFPDAPTVGMGQPTLSFSPPRPNVVEPPTYVPPDWTAARERIIEATDGNPLARQAALERFEEQQEAYQQEMERVHDAALQQAQQIILDNGGRVGTVDEIPYEIMQHLTPVEQENLRGFERTVRNNRNPETPDDVYYELHLAQEQGDAGRLGRLLLQNRDRISREHFTAFSAQHAAMVAGERQTIDDVNFGTMRTVIDRTMRGFGLDPNDDAETRMRLDVATTQWIDTQVRRNETVPTEPEINQYIRSQLTEITLNPPRPFNQRSRPAIEFDMANRTPDTEDDLTFDQLTIAADNGGLRIGDVDISLAQLVEARDILMETLERAPTMEELYGALSRMAGIR